MQVTFSSQAAPGNVNEDHVAAGPSWALVLDGATAPPGVSSGCRHDVRWFVDHLAAHLVPALTLGTAAPLTDVLAGAVATVRGDHEDTCDLDNPNSPSSTVALLRQRGNALDYLVLADSVILLDVRGDVRCITDDRLDHLPGFTTDVVAAHRNRAGGFWVASTSVDAPYEAVTGSVPVADIQRVALLSDGAARFTDVLGLGSWRRLLDVLETDGPTELIARVRAAERNQFTDDARGPHGRAIKAHDDATAALVTFPDPRG